MTTNHVAFPGACTLPNGDVFVVYRRSANHSVNLDETHGVIESKTSSDDGATWSAASTVYDNADQKDARDPTLIRLASDVVLMPFGLRGSVDTSDIVPMVGRLVAGSWSFVEVTNSFTAWAFASGAACQLSNGDVLVAYYGQDIGDTLQSVRVSRSSDDGVTWSHLSEVAAGVDGVSYQEPSLLVLGSQVLCFMRTTLDVAYLSTSADSGATWSTPRPVFPNGGRPTAIVDQTGRVLVYGRDPDESRYSYVWQSLDGSRSFPVRLRLALGDHDFVSVYAQLVDLGSEIGIAYAYERSIDGRIRWRRLADANG